MITSLGSVAQAFRLMMGSAGDGSWLMVLGNGDYITADAVDVTGWHLVS